MNQLSSLPATPATTFNTYKLLADFFDGKGDTPLTPAEVAVCLEWLHQVTLPTIFATPLRANVRTTATTSTRKPDMTPAKKQIQELLATRQIVMEENGNMNIDKPNEPSSDREESTVKVDTKVKRAVVITRTAKAILDVLDNQHKTNLEQTSDSNRACMAVDELKDVPLSESIVIQPIPLADQTLNEKQPQFSIPIQPTAPSQPEDRAHKKIMLPQFHFDTSSTPAIDAELLHRIKNTPITDMESFKFDI